MSLGLSGMDDGIPFRMITCADRLPGFEITSSLGPVEGIVEIGYSSSSSIDGLATGVGLDNMLFDAKKRLSVRAKGMGADAVIGFTYVVTGIFLSAGKHVAGSVVAYGSAVKCCKAQDKE